MTRSIEELETQIEQLVREHVAACQRGAAAAVERAFAAARAKPSRAKPSRTGRAPSRARGARRSPEEIAALGERLCEAVRAHPGETIRAVAPHVGATVRELERPMAQLKRLGRIRSVGQRSRTRYFPMAD